MWQARLGSALMSPREGDTMERKIPRARVLTYQAGRILWFWCSCPHTGTYSVVAAKRTENSQGFMLAFPERAVWS